MSTVTTTAPAPFLNDPLLNALEGLRFRLSTLAQALDVYFRTISSTPTYPPWSVLSTQAATVSSGMAAVSEHMAIHYSLFSEYGVFPNTTFPGHTEPAVLMQLLRKKLEPGVEDWLAAGAKVAELWVKGKGGIAGAGKLRQKEWETLWKGDLGKDWTREEGDEELMIEEEDGRKPGIWLGARREMQQLGHESQVGMLDYTKAEREMGVENVPTGLKRKLRASLEEDDDDDDDEEEEDEEDEDTASTDLPPMDMNDYLKFLNMGIMPPKSTPAPAPAPAPVSTSLSAQTAAPAQATGPETAPAAPGNTGAPTNNAAPT